MKILIIGSGGQLGTDCMRILHARQKYQVTGVDFPQVDIGSKTSVEKIFTETKPEVIINCAAYTAVDACETEREAAWKINSDGPRYIAELANSSACRVVHISTDYVFDGNKPVPLQYVEEDTVNPLSEYGKSKLAGEQSTQELTDNHIILRTAWLYSAHGPNLLKTMLKLALSDPDRAFNIVNDQFGSLTWSRTLARQVEVLLDTDLRGIVHTTSTGYSSWYEAACYFLDRMDIKHSFKPCTTEQYPTPAHRPANSILQNRVLEESNLSVFRSWKEDVDTFVVKNKQLLLEEARKTRGT
jgi:dTDP-4-dehydrorhamnose reductase